MAVYLFTFHSNGSWMPDRKRGYVEKDKGILPPDPEKAAIYRENMKEEVATFDNEKQDTLIDELLVAANKQRFRLHYVATESTHAHVLVSWQGFRPWLKVRNGIKQSMSRVLSRKFGQRRWLTQYASRKRVADRRHFDHLRNRYLPSHSGWKWDERSGKFK